MATRLTAVEITERINKTVEVIAKKEKSVARLEKEILTLTGYMKECRERDLRSRQQELKDKQQTLVNWQEKLEQLNEEERQLRQLPSQLEELRKQIADEIAEYEMAHRDKMRKDCKEMEPKEFSKKYSYKDRIDKMYKKDEKIRKEAEFEAKYWVLDLIKRVKEKVGSITDWNLHTDLKALNGWVRGTKGTATVRQKAVLTIQNKLQKWPKEWPIFMKISIGVQAAVETVERNNS